jgi:hypothetical protein
MMNTSHSPVVGIFEEAGQAEHAVVALRRAGFSDEAIGVMVRGGPPAEAPPTVQADVKAEEGAAAGAVTGGVLGGLVGAGVALTIPAVGPAVALGLLAGALGGATLGITGGGLLGGLIGLGMSHEEASYYEREFLTGRTLVTVQADGRSEEAARILADCGAIERRVGATVEGRA